MSPSDLPVNEIGNKHLHFKHDINLEQSDSGFARAKIKDQLFVDHLLMQDFIDVYQHQNAEKLVLNLKQKGYNASRLGLNEKGLNPVAFTSFINRNDAVSELRLIQRKENKDAWIFESN